ncbi:hypothetical protein P3S68_012119 [Capsicum galapagoense]
MLLWGEDVTGSSRGNSLLQKCNVRLHTINPCGSVGSFLNLTRSGVLVNLTVLNLRTQEENLHHFMANIAQGEEELTRDLLIAISNLLPNTMLVEIHCSSNDAMATSGDATQDFRSQLMSISHTQSPDVVLCHGYTQL